MLVASKIYFIYAQSLWLIGLRSLLGWQTLGVPWYDQSMICYISHIKSFSALAHVFLYHLTRLKPAVVVPWLQPLPTLSISYQTWLQSLKLTPRLDTKET